MAKDSLTVTDNRTGRSYEMPIKDGAVRAIDFRDVKVDEKDFGLLVYDPGFSNTASCRSAITRIDGEAGVLEYRGYPIEQLAEKSTYIETAYLLIPGDRANKHPHRVGVVLKALHELLGVLVKIRVELDLLLPVVHLLLRRQLAVD